MPFCEKTSASGIEYGSGWAVGSVSASWHVMESGNCSYLDVSLQKFKLKLLKCNVQNITSCIKIMTRYNTNVYFNERFCYIFMVLCAVIAAHTHQMGKSSTNGGDCNGITALQHRGCLLCEGGCVLVRERLTVWGRWGQNRVSVSFSEVWLTTLTLKGDYSKFIHVISMISDSPKILVKMNNSKLWCHRV